MTAMSLHGPLTKNKSTRPPPTLVFVDVGLKILLRGLYDAVATCKQAALILGIYKDERQCQHACLSDLMPARGHMAVCLLRMLQSEGCISVHPL